MNGFLDLLADELLERHGDRLGDVLVVLPSHRAALFLRKRLSERIDRPTLAPEIMAIEPFITRWSGLHTFDKVRLSFELYECYLELHEGDDVPDTIVQFSKWGQILLQDFNEVDRYLIPADELYRSLVDIKRIEMWMRDGDPEPTPLMQKFLDFWDTLGPLYHGFRERLLNMNGAYQGMLYRHLCEDLEAAGKRWPTEWKGPVYVAGFNAINKAEEVLFDWLVKEKGGHLRWDADRFYLDQPKHEAGMFLRRFCKNPRFLEEGELRWTHDHWATTPKKINVWATAKNMAQAHHAGTLLKSRLKSDPQLKNTALVLANEDMLLPVLNALPAEVKHVNLTMGYPIRHGLVIDFLEQLLRHQESIEKSVIAGKGQRLYHRNVIRLLTHPLWNLLYPNDPSARVHRLIVERNLMFFSDANLQKWWGEFGGNWSDRMNHVFAPWSQTSPTETLLQWAQDVRADIQLVDSDRVTWEREFLFQVYKVLVQLRDLNERFGRIDSIASLRTFIRPLLQQQELPFYGEPLQGLQIMGMLETRTLDFECVMIFSVNEEILPMGTSSQSFIPFDLKAHYGLPSTGEKDAIFAYHFYRLLQRASEVHLIHTTQTDDFGSGERSRYITQIEHELAHKYKSVIEYNEGVVSTPLTSTEDPQWMIDKSPALVERLNEMLDRGLSPSALNRYLQAPLEFYFQYVLRLREAEEVEESLESSTFGDVVHHALEQLYVPYVGKVISEEVLNELLKEHEQQVDRSWNQKYRGGNPYYGTNFLGIQAARTYVKRFLEWELQVVQGLNKKREVLTLIDCEHFAESSLRLPNGKEVKIHGYIDRVHRIGDTYYVVDYKSGTVDKNSIKWKGWERVRDNDKTEKTVQLMVYSWLWHRAAGTPPENIKAGIYWLRQPSKPDHLTCDDKNKKALTEEDLLSFEAGLAEVIMEMLDERIPFANAPDAPYLIFSKSTE